MRLFAAAGADRVASSILPHPLAAAIRSPRAAMGGETEFFFQKQKNLVRYTSNKKTSKNKKTN